MASVIQSVAFTYDASTGMLRASDVCCTVDAHIHTPLYVWTHHVHHTRLQTDSFTLQKVIRFYPNKSHIGLNLLHILLRSKIGVDTIGFI